MTTLIPTKTQLSLAMVVVAAMLVIAVRTQGEEPARPQSDNTTSIQSSGAVPDIRSDVRRKKPLKDGYSLIYRASDHELYAKAEHGTILSWSARSLEGAPLLTRVIPSGADRCMVCVRTPRGSQSYYRIPCYDVPPPPSRDPKPHLIACQWRVNNSDTVNANEPYELHNTRRTELKLSSQVGPVGDTFGFIGTKGGHFVFRRPNESDHGPVRQDEVVALYNVTSGKYKNRHGWTSSPSYEWRLDSQQGASFALYNIQQRDYLILREGSWPVAKFGWRKD